MDASPQGRDLNVYSPEYAANWQDILKTLRQEAPISWSNAYGGFWVVTKYDDIVHIERNPQIFSCDNDLNGERQGGQGITIPRSPYRLSMLEADPPEHTALRKLEAPFFTHQALEKWFDFARDRAHEQIDLILARGGGDFVEDYCVPVPAQTTLALVGVPREDWRDYLDAASNAFLPKEHPDYPHAARARITARIEEMMESRRTQPRDDIITTLVNAQIDGAPLDPAVARGILQANLFGGFDTTAATTENALHWLEGKTDLLEQLRTDDKFLAKAVDEFLRYFPPVMGGLSRTVVQETELRGQVMKPGQRVLMMFNSGNFDEERFECPHTLDIDRRNNKQHLAFGAGPHRCLGAVLGSAEVGIMIRAVAERMPNYRIDREKARRVPVLGSVNMWLTMPFQLG